MLITREKLRAYRPQIEEIGRHFGVAEVRVFGSVAKDTARADSDLDLLVQMEAGRSLLDLVGFEQSVSDLLDVDVDVVAEGGIHPLLEPRIRQEAQPI